MLKVFLSVIISDIEVLLKDLGELLVTVLLMEIFYLGLVIDYTLEEYTLGDYFSGTSFPDWMNLQS